jgi:hypothetical protein
VKVQVNLVRRFINLGLTIIRTTFTGFLWCCVNSLPTIIAIREIRTLHPNVIPNMKVPATNVFKYSKWRNKTINTTFYLSLHKKGGGVKATFLTEGETARSLVPTCRIPGGVP